MLDDPEFKQEILSSEGLHDGSVLPGVLRTAQDLLGIRAYYTAGHIEARSWFIRVGAKAPEAGTAIHSSFDKGFLGAEVLKYDDVIKNGGISKCKQNNLVKVKGRDYVVEESDVIEFRVKNARS